jgi:hypothetical protein
MLRAPALCILLSSAAMAAESDFGKEGQIVPNGTLSISYSKTGSDSSMVASVSPDIAYFIADHLALGLAIEYRVTQATVGGVDTGAQTSAGIAPYGAIDLPISPLLSFWPRAGIEVLSTPGDRRAVAIVAFAPLLVHPARHFFFGAGPGLNAEVLATVPSQSTSSATMSTTKRFTILASSIVGGYF